MPVGRLSGLPTESARIAERASHIEASIDRLLGLPTDVARLSERLTSLCVRVDDLPTRAEVKSEIEAVDRAGAGTQPTVAIVGGLVTIAVAVITYAPKLLAVLH